MTRSNLNIGCGRSPKPGWINLNEHAGPGVDIVFDLERCGTERIPLEDDSVGEISGIAVLEHISNILPLMQELHRVAAPNARAVFQVPYGSSDEADEDPTHVRRFFMQSFGYFSQPFYWKADYGYRGDWKTEDLVLWVSAARYQGVSEEEILSDIHSLRNVVIGMEATLRAIKPIRPPDHTFRTVSKTRVQLVS